MTLGKLILKTAIAIGLFSLWKLIFFGYFDSSNLILLILFYGIAMLIAIAVVRRLGVLNFLENFLIMFIWLLFGILLTG
ncbi:MAG: hypothetical protein R3B41_03485 [Candidatus Doudnabacteria bacterium]